MDEELIVVEFEEEIENELELEDIEEAVEQEESIDYVEVEDQQDVEVEVEEALGWVGGDARYHASLDGRHDPDQHSIEAITGLYDQLHKLSTVTENHGDDIEYHSHYSAKGGFAEFYEWKDGGHYKTDEYYKSSGDSGFFVSLVQETGNIGGGNIKVDICKKINDDQTTDVTDVYGVTVTGSGYYGNQDEKYDRLISTTPNREFDSRYAKVCLIGSADVRISAEEYATTDIGDYVVPNELGFAKKSNNNIGFRVISKGQKIFNDNTVAWYYVKIALVPQNDNIARVMEEVKKTQGNLSNMGDTISDINTSIEDMLGINIEISNKFNDINSIVNNSNQLVNDRLETSKEVLEQAQKIANQAQNKMEEMAESYATVKNSADKASTNVQTALASIEQLQKNMNIIAQWDGENGEHSINAFVNQVNDDHSQLGTLTSKFGKDGSELAAIIQKIDANGAAIQHLVTHVDKYILGEESPADGLTLNQTGFIQPGTIYMPTVSYDTTYTYEYEGEVETENGTKIQIITKEVPWEFTYGKSYVWKKPENPVENDPPYMWEVYKDVYLTKPMDIEGLSKDDLWYCWQDIIENDKYLYNPQTLHCWNGNVWVPVASANSDDAKSIGSVAQTARDFQIAYSNLDGKMAQLRVDVDNISSSVEDESQNKISSIHQTASEIMMGVYDTDDDQATSLGVLLDGVTSTSMNLKEVRIKSVQQAPSVTARKYNDKPVWRNGCYVMPGEDLPDDNGIYYFDPDDSKHKYYCKITSPESYEVWGINNIAMASLNSRVSDTESAVESWTRFEKGQNATMTSIGQTANETGASISSIVYGDFIECVEVNEGDPNYRSREFYSEPPKWVSKENSDIDKWFQFDGDPVYWNKELQPGDSAYCLSTNHENIYYKLYFEKEFDDKGYEIVKYEKYEMKSSPYSALVQKVENGKSTIGLIAGDNDTMGSVIVNTINDKSTVDINADKISINGLTTFQSLLNPGKTTINGDYIASGSIVSNNYKGPITHVEYGLKIDGDKLVEGEPTDYIYYASVVKDASYDTYQLNPKPGDTYQYYSCSEINKDILLTSVTSESGNTITTKYIVCASDFDLLFKKSDDYVAVGTRFDLNNGTIFSNGLTLDRNGNLSITGNVNATSGSFTGKITAKEGTIGGFTIDDNILYSQQSLLESVVNFGADGVHISPSGIGLGNGKFVVKKNGTLTTYGDIYMKTGNPHNSTSKTLVEIKDGSLSITGKITAEEGGTIGGFTVGSNNLNSQPSNSTTEGVYVGTDKINLGRGKFVVDNQGNLTTQGNITLKGSNGTELLKISGNSITFSGSGGSGDSGSSSYSDSNVESYLSSKYGITATSLSKAQISSPKISGGEISGGALEITGQGRYRNSGNNKSALYIKNGSILKGYISFDDEGSDSEESSKERMFITTLDGTALKIAALGGNMSLDAKTIFMEGTVRITGEAQIKDKTIATQDWVNSNFAEEGHTHSNIQIKFS